MEHFEVSEYLLIIYFINIKFENKIVQQKGKMAAFGIGCAIGYTFCNLMKRKIRRNFTEVLKFGPIREFM